MQIVIILRKILNTALSEVCSVSLLQFSSILQLQLIFGNSNVKNNKQIKQKMVNFFSGNYQIFFFLILLREAILESKLLLLSATAQPYCYTLVRPFPTLSSFPFFSQSFFIETISCFVYQLLKKYCVVMCLNT